MGRDARAEAFERLGGRYEVRVLEPSPPADDRPPWFADDPVARGYVPDGRQLVSPIPTGDLTWEQIAEGDAELSQWCRDRWLGPYRRLGSLPDGYETACGDLHRLAEHVMKPAREQANGKFGLRYTYRGFGTPFFGDDVQVRIEGSELVEQRRGDEDRSTLKIPESSIAAIADWFGFAYSVLEPLRAGAGAAHDPSRVQIWPEHFDAALELGSEQQGLRAAYGASPGDDQHPEPYLYVAPWSATPEGELWNAVEFSGAELAYADLLEAEDQRALATEFFTTRLVALTTG